MDAPVRIELSGCEPTSGVARLVDRGPPARVARAAASLVVCWAAAAVCVFIPLLHFVLVPGLLVTGAVLAVLRLREDVTLAELRGACPRCKAERTYSGGGRWRDGRSLHCDGCGNAFTLHVGTVPRKTA